MEMRLYEETLGQTSAGDRNGKRQVAHLRLVSDMLSVDDVIAQHVTRKWQDMAQDEARSRAALVANIEAGLDFGGVTLEAAISRAQAGFRQGAFLFFWNDEQITEPQTRLNVALENEAVFLRLFPMKGG